jgi:hypothetical protein
MQLSMRCFRAGEKRELEETAWHQLLGEVCFWPLADISIALPNVRYCGSKAEGDFLQHVCPLLAQSGRWLVPAHVPLFGGKADMAFCDVNVCL